MLKGFRKLSIEKMKELYSDQCSPCMLGYPECGGDQDKAKAWNCPKFYNGLMIMEIPGK